MLRRESIDSMQEKSNIDIEEACWLNPVANFFSVHIRDKDCGLMFSNGKGTTKESCLARALGEYFERLSSNYFFAKHYLRRGKLLWSTCSGLSLDGFNTHKKLVESYNKLHLAKQNNWKK